MIQVENVHKTLGDQKVLDGISLTIDQGTMICLLGMSGAGKTVLLKNMIGLFRPDAGRVLIDGLDIHRSKGREASQVRNSVGVLFQGGALFDSMTVYDNLAFPLREKTTLSEEDIRNRVQEHLEMVEMDGSEKKYPAELSGGMKKRVALARTLALSPRTVFFDEPEAGLDPLMSNSILLLIHLLHQKIKFTGVMVTHHFRKVFQIVQKVAMLHHGKIIAYGEPEDVMKSTNEIVAQYMRGVVEGPLEVLKSGA